MIGNIYRPTNELVDSYIGEFTPILNNLESSKSEITI